MSLLEELHLAAYKGIKFLMMSSTVTGGRKDIRHSFPNSDKQKIEDLGLAPKVFNVTAIISGDSYIQDRDRFISVLEDNTPGVLIHPWFGQLNNYKARSYTLLENLTTLGEAKFSIVFEISNIEGIPIKAQNTLSVLEAANDALIAAVKTDVATNYNITTSFIGNFSDATEKANNLVTAFRDNTALVSATADEINAFNQELSTFESNITSLVQNPQELVDSMSNLFGTIDSLYPTVTSTVEVMKGFFDFGDDDTTINPTTAGLSERLKNRNVMNQSNQMLGLSYAYFNTAQITFDTVIQIEESAAELETQYQKIIDSDGLGDSTKSVLTDMRAAMQEFFEEQRINARQLLNVDTNLTSARLLSFQYYNDSGQAPQLIELNGFKDVSFVAGSVQVLTE